LELFAGLFENTPTDRQLLHFRSLSGGFCEIKAELIEKGLIPECCRFLTSDPLEDLINRLTRESGGNVGDREIIDTTASSVVHVLYIAKYVADLTDVRPIFLLEIKPNQWIE
jgi:hypothetical protein